MGDFRNSMGLMRCAFVTAASTNAMSMMLYLSVVLNVLQSINEPTAAVTAYGLDKKGDGKRMRRFMRIGRCFNNCARYSQLRRKASLS